MQQLFHFPQKHSSRQQALLCCLAVCCAPLCAASAQVPPGGSAPAVLMNAPQPARVPFSSRAQTPSNTPAAAIEGGSKVYLSFQQALTMALKNNLDIELEQADQTIADLSIPLAKGGGLPRSINYTVADTPAGEAPLAVPLLSFSAPGLSPQNVDPVSSNVSSSYDTSRVLEGSHTLALIAGAYSGGSPVPGFDAQLFGRYGWLRRNPAISLTTVTTAAATAADTVTTDNTLGDTTLTKGFGPGTTVQLGVNDFVQSFYSGRSSAVPFSHPNAYALIAQPLLRGAGQGNNTRYIAIAKTNREIAAAVLQQQLISTVTGVGNLYVDLISLQDAVKVQDQALAAAELLLHNDQEQLNVGRLPAIEVARAEALVTSTRLVLTQAIALRDQQSVILRTLLDPQSLTTGDTNVAEFVATDALASPPSGGDVPLPELIKRAWEQRPDVQGAALQVTNGQRQVASAANAARPELDLYGTYESRGVVIPGLTTIGENGVTGNAVTNPVPTGGNRSSTIYEAGLQFYLPAQNRVAKANLGADAALLREEQIRLTQLKSQVAAEIQNAVTALHAAQSAADASTKARELQAQLLAAAKESFSTGYGTNIAVIEQQTVLAQAQTTEVLAKASWLKAAGQLDRVLGQTLERNGISLQGSAVQARPAPQ